VLNGVGAMILGICGEPTGEHVTRIGRLKWDLAKFVAQDSASLFVGVPRWGRFSST
jgi:hypothetical protein